MMKYVESKHQRDFGHSKVTNAEEQLNVLADLYV